MKGGRCVEAEDSERERWRFGYGGNIETGEPIFDDKLAICSNTWMWE